MIRDAKNRKFDVILTKSISRFARNTVDTLKFIRFLREKGVSILFEEENINSGAIQGELLITILGSLAQQESENIASHILTGKEMAIKNGTKKDYHFCYGYDYIKENGSLVINKQSENVKIIFNLYLKYKSRYKVCTELKRLGIKSPRGSDTWTSGSLLKILENEKYIGNCVFGRYYVCDSFNHRTIKNHGEREIYKYIDHHEPIISKEDFYKVQEIFKAKQSTTSFRRVPINRVHTFTSKFRCSYCGEPYIKKSSYRNKTVWACKSFIKKGRYLCPESKVAYEDIIKKAFVEGVNLLLDKNEFDLDEFVKDISSVLDEDKSSIALRKAKASKFDIESKMSKLIDLFLENKIDKDTFDKKRNSYLEQILELTNKIDSLSSNTSNDNNQERIINIKNNLLSELSSEKQFLSSFDSKLFDELVLYGCVGGYDENDDIDPYMIRFIIKTDVNEKIRENMISDIIVNNNHIGDEDNIFKPILDFRIKQNFCTFEQIENKNTKVNHDSVRVRFEVENI